MGAGTSCAQPGKAVNSRTLGAWCFCDNSSAPEVGLFRSFPRRPVPVAMPLTLSKVIAIHFSSGTASTVNCPMARYNPLRNASTSDTCSLHIRLTAHRAA